jgi:hypothetical protein
VKSEDTNNKDSLKNIETKTKPSDIKTNKEEVPDWLKGNFSEEKSEEKSVVNNTEKRTYHKEKEVIKTEKEVKISEQADIKEVIPKK